MKKQTENRSINKTTVILSIVLVVAVAVLVALIIAHFSLECTHFLCDKESFAPTCNEAGYTRYSCTSCDYEFDAEFIAPTGHSYTSTDISPTCEDEGYTEHTCTACGEVMRDKFISPLGHSYEDIITNPTCEAAGYTTSSCQRCDFEVKHDYVEPTGHTLSARVIAPECEKQGYTVYTCEDCDYKHTSDYTEPLGHRETSRITSPTCDEVGYTTHTCTKCGYSYKNNYTDPIGHTYKKTYVRPNIEKTGYTLYTCTICGSEHIGDYVFYTDIFTGAAGDGKGKSSAWGLDLSHHSENVDFVALKSMGVDFVILRVGFNKSLDSQFESYYSAAKAAGLDVGVYFFTLAETKADAIADAKRVAGWLEGKKLEYPVFYDVENYVGASYYPSLFTEQQIMDITLSFMQTMVDEGYYPGIYTNNNLLYTIYNSEKALCLYDVWYARYPGEGVDIDDFVYSNIDSFSKTYSMWQYMGDVYGFGGAVEGACDVNYAFKDYPAIMKQFGFNGYQ